MCSIEKLTSEPGNNNELRRRLHCGETLDKLTVDPGNIDKLQET